MVEGMGSNDSRSCPNDMAKVVFEARANNETAASDSPVFAYQPKLSIFSLPLFSPSIVTRVHTTVTHISSDIFVLAIDFISTEMVTTVTRSYNCI